MGNEHSSALRPFLIKFYSKVPQAHWKHASEAVERAGLPYKPSTVKSMLNDDRPNFERVAPATYRLRAPEPVVESLPSPNCTRCGLSMLERDGCKCVQPTDVVMAALRKAVQSAGGPLKVTSLHVALLTDQLFERGCEIAGVRRDPDTNSASRILRHGSGDSNEVVPA